MLEFKDIKAGECEVIKRGKVCAVILTSNNVAELHLGHYTHGLNQHDLDQIKRKMIGIDLSPALPL